MLRKAGFRAYSLGQREPLKRRASARRRPSKKPLLEYLGAASRALVGERRTLLVVALPLLLLAAMLALYNLPALRVARVEVVGARALDVARVRAALNLEGKNILAVDPSFLEKGLRQNPLVKGVSIHRQFPDRLIIKVEERRPFALWQTKGGTFVVDEEGYVLSDSPPLEPLLTITAEDGGLRVGSQVPRGIMGLARDLLQRLPREAGALPRQFHFSPSQGLAVVTDQGWKAIFGDERDLEFKMAVMAKVLQAARGKDIHFEQMDLRFGDRPYLR